MSDRSVSLVKLNQRAPSEVKEAFENAVVEKYGRAGRRAGFEFEREVRAYLDMGEADRNRELIQSLADSVGQADRKKNFSQDEYPRQSDSTVVQYRLPECLVSDLKAVAKESFRTIGECVGRIMWRYVTDGSVIERNNARLERIETAVAERFDDETSRKDEKQSSLIRALDLDDQEPFDLEQFDEANENSIDQGKTHARETWLPKVLDELGYTYSPYTTGLFVASETVPTPEDERDPRTKPYFLMDDDEKELAVKVAAYEKVSESSRTLGKLTTDEAVDVMHGRPRRTTARDRMRAVANRSPGFRYDDSDDVLKLDQRTIDEAPANDDVRQLVEDDDQDDEGEKNTDETGKTDAEPETEDDTPGLGSPKERWLDEAVDRVAALPDELPLEPKFIDNKIARAKYPNEFDENGGVRERAFDSVTESERQDVLDALDDSDDVEATEEPETPDETPGSETSPNAGKPLAADGGQVVEEFEYDDDEGETRTVRATLSSGSSDDQGEELVDKAEDELDRLLSASTTEN